jgi:hypothetical protein
MIREESCDLSISATAIAFAINIPPNFQRDVLAGRQPEVQVNVDATRMSQAFTYRQLYRQHAVVPIAGNEAVYFAANNILDIAVAGVLAGRQPEVQVNVDATRMSQAFTGNGYIQNIISGEDAVVPIAGNEAVYFAANNILDIAVAGKGLAHARGVTASLPAIGTTACCR